MRVKFVVYNSLSLEEHRSQLQLPLSWTLSVTKVFNDVFF